MRKFCFLLRFILRWMQASLQPLHILKSGGERGESRERTVGDESCSGLRVIDVCMTFVLFPVPSRWRDCDWRSYQEHAWPQGNGEDGFKPLSQ